MAQELIFILLVFAVVWLWLDSARAREIATELAKVLCQRKGVQFLDGTVALRRLHLCDLGSGKRIARVFNFDYADETGARYQGNIQTCGRDVTDASLGIYIQE